MRRLEGQLPVIPVDPGIFSIVLPKCSLVYKNSEATQCLTKFPLPGKREFIRA
jgi:hypothetical protein